MLSPPFVLFVSVALACIVGSENGQVNHRPQASTTGRQDAIISPFIHSVKRFFDGFFYQEETVDTPILSADQLDSYFRDGYVVISGLLDTEQMNSLSDAGDNIVSNNLKKTDGKLPSGNFQVHEFGPLMNDERFRDVAMYSKLPRVAAELMQLDRNTQNLRILRDVFLAKGHESTSSCGWHVDDQLFWPSAYDMPEPSKVDQTGINAWIALDDMPHGGGMAVSPASHIEDFSWRNEALDALNFNDKFSNGIEKDDLFEMIKTGKVDSCGLEKVVPHVYDEIEMSKQEFDFKKGDIIYMNRWLFHKSTDLTEQGKVALQAIQKSFGDDDDQSGAALLKRYSLRYATGSSSLPGGFMTELSVLASDGLNLGKELNEVRGEWYPKVWPDVDVDVEEKIEHLVMNEVPVAKEKLGAIMAEVMSMFRSR